MATLLEVDRASAGRRERKKRATRLALKAAALDLVATRGYANVTVEDIADAVDVSVRTFFNYFASKDAAIVGDDPELVEAMRDELLSLPKTLDPLAALRTVLLDRIAAIGEDIDRSGEDHATWQRRFALVRSEPEVLLAYAKRLIHVEQVLTDAVVERLGGKESNRLYASLVTTSALGVMRVAGMFWGGEGGTEALIELASRAFDSLEAGLGVEGAPAKRLARLKPVIPRTEAIGASR